VAAGVKAGILDKPRITRWAVIDFLRGFYEGCFKRKFDDRTAQNTGTAKPGAR
jgi:hypothetical protein